MLLPAALCCSVSVVQASSRVVAPGLLAQRGPYDPRALLRTSGRIALFFSSAAVPHTAAGVLTCTCLLATCAAWPSTLNVVPLAVFSVCLWRWAHPRTSTPGPRVAPFLGTSAAAALAAWAAVQLAVTYAAQISQFAAYLPRHQLAWLHIGVFHEQPDVTSASLLALHAAALLGLHLSLSALAGCSSSEVRLWPQAPDVAAAVAEQLAARTQAQQEPQAPTSAPRESSDEPALGRSGGSGQLPQLSPMLARWPSTPLRASAPRTPRLPWPADGPGPQTRMSTGMCSLGQRSEGGALTPRHTSPASLGRASVIDADIGMLRQRSASLNAPSFADQLRPSEGVRESSSLRARLTIGARHCKQECWS